MRNRGMTTPDALARAHRRAEAVRLRAEGLTIRQISARLDVSVGTVHADLDRALRDVPAEDVDALRAVELDRLDALHRAVWEEALQGNLGAVDRALRISAQRCRLMGLDAPQRVAMTSTDLDLDAAVAALVEAAQTPVEHDPILDYSDDELVGGSHE